LGAVAGGAKLLSEVTAALKEVPEVIEAQGLSGIAGLLIQVVARDADDLYRIAGQILTIKGVRRTSAALLMRELVDFVLAQPV
jgi:DNA-binding Lrp family transcriptional regulator